MPMTISKKIKLAVLTEAGYHCASPNCHNELTVDVHHIVEVSKNGGNEPGNLLPLCPYCHVKYHKGFIPSTSIRAWKKRIVNIYNKGTNSNPKYYSKEKRREPKDALSVNAISEQYLYHPKIHLITSDNLKSFTPIPSDFLKSDSGTFAIWVFIHPINSNEGLRREKDHYIISHNTSNTPVEGVYPNLFSFGIYPNAPEWRINISNNNPADKYYCKRYPDTHQLSGWHHFVIRWNHPVGKFELVIDRRPVITMKYYFSHWPREYSDYVFIGTWPNKKDIYFINTFVYRTYAVPFYLQDDWISDEYKKSPTSQL